MSYLSLSLYEFNTTNKSDNSGLQQAIRCAFFSKVRFRVGAAVWGVGGCCNSRKGHPALRTMGYPEWCNRHAELALVLACGKKLERATVYVARLLQDDSPGMAKPCQFCMHVLTEVGVKRVVWTTGDVFSFGAIKL